MNVKAVNLWTWRRMLRDHGPTTPSVLLTLYTIGTYMDGEGFCFVGQQRIADGARTSMRSVQRHIATARRTGWIHVELTRTTGKKNPHLSFLNNYRACVPEYVELSDTDEELRDVLLSQQEEIEGDDTAMAARYPEGDDTGSRTCRHWEHKVPPNEGEVTTQLCRKNSSVLNSSVLTLQSEGATQAPHAFPSEIFEDGRKSRQDRHFPLDRDGEEEVHQESDGARNNREFLKQEILSLRAQGYEPARIAAMNYIAVFEVLSILKEAAA